MNQLDVFGKNIFQAETIDRMGVAAADFHHAVMASGAGQAANLFRRLRNQFGWAKLIYESHPELLHWTVTRAGGEFTSSNP